MFILEALNSKICVSKVNNTLTVNSRGLHLNSENFFFIQFQICATISVAFILTAWSLAYSLCHSARASFPLFMLLVNIY